MKRLRLGKAHIAALLLCAVCAALVIALSSLSSLLDSQHTAERWRGESDMKFGQVSCFLPSDEKISLEQIYSFRNELQKKLQETAVDDGEIKPFNDAFCAFGKVNVSGSHGSGEVHATAVGGGFFDFHPLPLVSGSYLSDSDLMRDRVLIDEETAWLLFGGRELSGMSFKINGRPFVVAGVFRHEDDAANKRAYSGGMEIYMPYEAYLLLTGGEEGTSIMTESAVSCYELVLAEPVTGFAYSVCDEKFPIGSGLIVDNARRYNVSSLFKLLRDFGSRSMQRQGVVLPYWENAARCTEDWSALLLCLFVLCAVYPLLLLIRLLFTYGRRGKNKLSDELLPEAKNRLEEQIRLRQRRHWERTHPNWDRNTRNS